jgi:acetyltransferase-like isoleucine patch superfamily enzyme
LAPGVKLFSASDDYSGEYLTGPTLPAGMTGGSRGKITLRRHVLLGAGTVVLPGCTLDEGAAVGALSLVIKSLASWGLYAGIPCRLLRPRKKDLLKIIAQVPQTTPA